MNKKATIFLTIICLLLAVIGLIIILRSVSLGITAASNDLFRVGGMDIDEIRIRQENHITSYRWIGALLMGAGIFTLLLRINLNKLFEQQENVDNVN
jgi:hypothetical protein